jgi:DNA-binding IclR family transcriptional regulator
MSSDTSYTVPSVDRAIEVLEILATSRDGISLNELTELTHVPKSTLFRILATLEQRRYVRQDRERKKFALGLKLWELSNAKLEKIDLVVGASKHMKKLAFETHESVFLAILDRGEVIYLQRVEGPATEKAVTKLGWRAPIHATATGQLLLAFLPDSVVDALLEVKKLPAYNVSTITKVDDLKRKLERVRADGYAVADGEYNSDLLCIAAPIRNSSKRVIAALTIAVPSHISDKTRRVPQIVNMLRVAAADVSHELGYSDNSKGMSSQSFSST